jgi:asparagine synthase (glutamine-hydrolysing)
LLAALKTAIYTAITNSATEARLAVAFSGGVDSTLLAKACSDLGKGVVLITIGFLGSHDIDFSKRIAVSLGLPHRTITIDQEGFRATLTRVRKITGCDNTSHIENCVAYHYVALAAREEGLRLVLSANGCDELFCGYNSYRMVYDKGSDALGKLVEEKIANERLLADEISAVAKEFEIVVRQPFLDSSFVSFAKTVPFDLKITGSQDMLRKHILRQVAIELGVPKESAMKPKKALQYGTLIHKNYQKVKNIRSEF